MTHPAVAGAVLRIDLRGFAGDLPPALGAPLRETSEADGTRSLFYDLSSHAAGEPVEEGCTRLARVIDRLFLAPEPPPFADAFARRMRLELGLAVGQGTEPFSHAIPLALLACLADAEADLGLSYYPCADDPDAIVEEI